MDILQVLNNTELFFERHQGIISVIGITVSVIVAFSVLYLTKKLGFRDKMDHAQKIRNQVNELLVDIRKGLNREVLLLNVKKYTAHYPQNNEKNWQGYTCMKAELKTIRFNGISFFADIKELYIDEKGKYTLAKTQKKADFNVFKVGIIPYEWIELINPEGDEYDYIPIFFTYFKGRKKSPYHKFDYYKESEHYRKGHDPIDMKFERVYIK